MKIITAILLLVCVLGRLEARSTENAMSAAELRAGCEAALAMAKDQAVTDDQKIAGLTAMAYIDGYVEALTIAQSVVPTLKILHIPEGGRLRIAYVQAVHAFIVNNPKIEKEGSARLVVMLAIKQNYSQ